ncbi:MAG: ATP-binding protein [Bacteroidota bacterium]
MRKGVRPYVPALLISASLLLLLGFLYSWLSLSYQAEKAALQRETDGYFLNAVRDVKEELTAGLLPRVLSSVTDSLSDRNVIVRKEIKNFGEYSGKDIQEIKIDTLQLAPSDGQAAQIALKTVIPDSLLEIALSSKVKGGSDEEGIEGALAIFIEMDKQTLSIKEDSIRGLKADVLALLTEQFHKRVASPGPVGEYQVVRLSDSLKAAGNMVSEKYTDSWSGEQFAVVLSAYQPYLMKKLLPQILFSLLLLLSVGGAFGFIYRAWQKQQRLTAIKNDFISNITHELKTPITTVGVAIEALSSFDALKDPERTKEYLQISKHELNRLSILVDKVLKMSLFEKQEPELKLEPLDLQQLIEEILASMKLQFEKYSAHIQFHSTGNDFVLKADRIHLTNVIYNLLDNALKYSLHQPVIQVDLKRTEHQLKLQISDQGIGIPKEYKEKIFDKFFRVPKGDAHNVKGYGLGLAYVSSVVRQHKGEIGVESQAGKGSCFTLSLPDQASE